MCTALLKTMLIGALLAAQGAETAGSGAVPDRPEPCYVVIAIDVSGNMENSDAAVADAGGRRQTLRDDGQLIFLQLLPFLRSDLYVGVGHFSERVRYALPSEGTGPLLPWGGTFLTESAPVGTWCGPSSFRARTERISLRAWVGLRIVLRPLAGSMARARAR